MDEPTNDLDVETLELLEELLLDYQGTLLLVSHDRDFLDNVVTSTLALEGDGRLGDYVGGYSDWLRQRPVSAAATTPAAAPYRSPPPLPRRRPPQRPPRRRRNSATRTNANWNCCPPGSSSWKPTSPRAAPPCKTRPSTGDAAAQQRANGELAAQQAELDAAYARWEALDG